MVDDLRATIPFLKVKGYMHAARAGVKGVDRRRQGSTLDKEGRRVDTQTYDKVRDLYVSLGEWSRNRSFHDFADARTHRALRLARHLAVVRRAMDLGADGGGRFKVERRPGGGVAIHFNYLSIAARWTAFLSDREYQLITEEVLPVCESQPRPSWFVRPS